MEALNVFVSISAPLFSVIAIYFTWRIYKKESTVSNENFIYQKKYDSYKILFDLSVDFLNAADEAIKAKQKGDNKDLEAKILAFERIEDEIEIQMYKQSFITSSRVTEEFAALLYKDAAPISMQTIEEWEAFSTFYYEKIDKIHTLIKEELHVDDLNQKMFQRIRTKKR